MTISILRRCGAGLIAVAIAVAVPGCGGGKREDAPRAALAVESPLPALPMPALGVESPAKLGYAQGAGARDYARALAAYEAQPRDWTGVRSACEAALAKDEDHLDAHRLLARALAQTGAQRGITEHLVAALAGDWLRWGPALAADADLTPYLATAQGKALLALNDRMKQEVATKAASGLLVLARRSGFKVPARLGEQAASSRGEVYAYDLAGKRYLRLTHSDHQAVAFLRSPDGAEVAVIGYDRVAIATDEGTPLLARSWIQPYDVATWQPTGKRASLGKARAAAVSYGPGGQLLAITYPADGRWELGDATTYAIDRATGKVARTRAPAELGPRALITFEEAAVERPLDGVDAAWEGDPLQAKTMRLGDKTVTVPGNGWASRSTVSVSPDGKRLAFATLTASCDDRQQPSLYVVDVATGQPRHVLTANSRFGARWLDAGRLAYEDDTGAVRIYDAAAGRETVRIIDRGGLALSGLSAAPTRLCQWAEIEDNGRQIDGYKEEVEGELDGE